jgi:hypothetical protein
MTQNFVFYINLSRKKIHGACFGASCSSYCNFMTLRKSKPSFMDNDAIDRGYEIAIGEAGGPQAQ